MLSHMVPLMPCTRPPPWWWMWSPGAGRHGGSLAAAGWTLTRQLFSHLGRGTAGYSVGWGPQVKPSQGLRVHLLSPPWEPAEQEAALMAASEYSKPDGAGGLGGDRLLWAHGQRGAAWAELRPCV